jgi:uncharacterized membrane protein
MVIEQPPESLTAEEILAAPSPAQLLLQDHALQILLALTLALNLALLIFLVVRYDALPDPLPLHFDATGLPDRIESKSGILILPVIGLIVLVSNALLGVLVHQRERAATLLLAAGALFVQALMWLAAVNIAGGFV